MLGIFFRKKESEGSQKTVQVNNVSDAVLSLQHGSGFGRYFRLKYECTNPTYKLLLTSVTRLSGTVSN